MAESLSRASEEPLYKRSNGIKKDRLDGLRSYCARCIQSDRPENILKKLVSRGWNENDVRKVLSELWHPSSNAPSKVQLSTHEDPALNYCKEQLLKGITSEGIRKHLVRRGWKEEDANKLILSAGGIKPKISQSKGNFQSGLDYCAQALSKNAPPETIVKNLAAQGWNRTDAQSVLDMARSSEKKFAGSAEKNQGTSTVSSAHTPPRDAMTGLRTIPEASQDKLNHMESYLQGLLLNYCRSLIRKNVPPSKIKEILLQAGWRSDVVESLLSQFSKQGAVTPLPSIFAADQNAYYNKDLLHLYLQGILYNYCESALKRNITYDEIKSSLLKVGWRSEQIDTILEETIPHGEPVAAPSETSAALSKQTPKYNSLKNYIRLAIRGNVPLEKIREVLLKASWEPEQIRELFASAGFVAAGKDTEGIKSDVEEIFRDKNITIAEKYTFKFLDIVIEVIVYAEKGKPSKAYHMVVPVISQTTDLILEEIRNKLIEQINLGALDIAQGDFSKLDETIQERLIALVRESFPHVDENVHRFLISYLISKVLGLGIIEIIKADEHLEEIVVNSSVEPIYVYHKKWGWCSTNQVLRDDDEIVHLASMTGRKIGREISSLVPLLDANLSNGDRVNATLKPITAKSPTITIRKFSKDPWTITKFLQTKTMDYYTAALIWMAIQFELSALVVGGTASGKTSCLNVLTNLIPPSQRIISIEDTREIRLPEYMHWVPMVSRAANAEGKGGIAMEDLLVNSLRMRPDRIIVGEVRKREQAETLFEAIHTGHSVYATFHANDARETIIRLTNPPVSVPKTMMPAISLIIVQFRNRRSGLRRTFQIAETTQTGDANLLYQYNAKRDEMEKVNDSVTLIESLKLYTGSSKEDIEEMIKEKISVLNYMVRNDITAIEEVGRVIAMYYTDKETLFSNYISRNRKVTI